LIDRVLNQVTEQTRDQQPVLADLATRCEPFANELFDAWNKAGHQALASPIALDETSRAFFSALKQANLRGAYAAFGAWGTDAARSQIPFDAALRLVRASQHALLPFVLRAYANAPQLPLALDAVGDAFDALVAVIGAAYSEVMPARLAQGIPLHTVGQLTGGAAHALNDILAVVIGRTQLLIERVNDNALREELEAIQSTASVGARVVRRMQDYRQVDGAADAPSADVNLALRDAAELTRFVWRDQAEASGIVIDVVKDFADVPPAQIGAAALRRVCVALLLNAAEALPSGGRITLRTERKSDAVLISILDNGVGMADDVRTRLGELFFTTKPAPHLGLGVNGVAQIVTQNKGTWSVESQTGQGTTVTLSLPIARRSTEGRMRPMAATRSATILIIDNEPSVRDLLARLLKLHNHTIATAESGAEGIAAFKSGKFDLVFTDLGMPEMSGWDVAREIKKINAQTLVGLITGWPIDLTPEELRERGVDRVVGKPFDIPSLLSLIEDALTLKSKK
jgi:signal transduction histidine kinase/ActR/RegA family two-component response regulator